MLLVLDSDLTTPEAEALEPLLAAGKPVLLVLNRIDCWPEDQRDTLISSIRRRLPPAHRDLDLLPVASAPRRATVLADGRVRSEPMPPQVAPLRRALLQLLGHHGALLLGLNGLRAADRFAQRLHQWRLRRGKDGAQALIGRYAALKATGVAANPYCCWISPAALRSTPPWWCSSASSTAWSWVAAVPAPCSRGCQPRTPCLRHPGGHPTAAGWPAPGVAARRSLSGGLSLAPAAPVALAQAALAVHTTRLTGRLAAAELLRSAERGRLRPASLLRRLAHQDPQARAWLQQWQEKSSRPAALKPLLP